MKFLKGFVCFILGICLTVLLFCLSASVILKTIVSKNVVNILKSDALYDIIETNDSKLDDNQKRSLKNVLTDTKAQEIFDIFINNYLEYKTNKEYTISDKDIETIIDFAKAHEDDVIAISKGEIKKGDISLFTKDKIKEYALEGFTKVDQEVDTENTSTPATVYKYTVSINAMMYVGIAILVALAFIYLLTLSLTKTFKVFGIASIVSGIFNLTIYGLVALAKEFISGVEILKALDFSIILICGLTLFISGIVILVVCKIYDKKKID